MGRGALLFGACVALALLLGGCAPMIGREADWPKLDVEIIRIPDGAVFAKCYRAIPLWQKLLGAVPLGCAEFSFRGRWCRIWVGETSTDAVIEHEKEHCDGYYHL